MLRVASRENAKFKTLRRLAESPLERQRRRTTLIEGAHLCQAYLDRVGMPQSCVIGAGALANAEVARIIARLPPSILIEIDERLFASISQLESAPALLFVIAMPAMAAPVRVAGDAVLLDRIQDPGNLGALLRSAAAAGFALAYLSPGCAAAYGPRVLRAAMGAHFSMQIHEQCDLVELIAQSQLPVYATSSHGGEAIFDASFQGACAFLFGNEGQGIDAALLARTRLVTIPQPGGEESLNVAAAAAICLFEVVRQRRAGGNR